APLPRSDRPQPRNPARHRRRVGDAPRGARFPLRARTRPRRRRRGARPRPGRARRGARGARVVTLPLVVTDCDEVLLHMVRHFRAWLSEAHGIGFTLDGNPFASMIRRGESEPLPDAEKWRYLSL